MKKKVLILFLIVLAAVMFAFSSKVPLIAATSTTAGHKHTYGSTATWYSSTLHTETCTICGATRRTSHTASSYRSSGSTTHMRYCSKCRRTYGSSVSCSWSTSGGTYYNGSYHIVRCTQCTNTTQKAHTPGSYRAASSNTHNRECSVCGYNYGGAESCTWGSTYTNYDLNQDYRTCTKCTNRIYTNHNMTVWKYNDNWHWRVCSHSGCGAESFKVSHNHTGYEAIPGNTKQHYRVCECGHKILENHNFVRYEIYNENQHNKVCTCGYKALENHKKVYPEQYNTASMETDFGAQHQAQCEQCKRLFNREDCKFTKGGNYDTKSPHECEVCGRKKTKYPYHTFDITLVSDPNMSGATCKVVGCSASNSITPSVNMSDYFKQGDYSMLGSGLEYNPRPFLGETIKYVIKYPQTDINGVSVKLTLDSQELAFCPFVRGDLRSHIRTYVEERFDVMKETFLKAHGKYPESVEELINDFIFIVEDVEDVYKEYYDAWNGYLGTYAYVSAFMYENGASRPNWKFPNVEYNEQTHTFTISGLPTSGNYVFHSFYFADDRNRQALFRSGGKNSTIGNAPDPLYSKVVYRYLTTDGEIPKNDDALFGRNHYVKGPIIYDGRRTLGPTGGTYSVEANVNKIDATGYRYVGYTVTYNYFDKIYNTSRTKLNGSANANTTATANLSYGKNSGAVITFYLEPVQMYYGQAWVSTDKSTCQELSASGLSFSSQGKLLEAPDFFHGDTSNGNGSCYVDVKSLDKIQLPGFILNEYRAVEYNSNLKTMLTASNKFDGVTYTADTTTKILSEAKSMADVQKSVTFKSSYAPNGETAGHAKDKALFYVYTTPTVEIQHVNYSDGVALRGTRNEELCWVTQILNGNAYLASLDTGVVGSPHSLVMNTNSAGTNIPNRVQYDHSDKDLVQIQIYELPAGKSPILRATMYADSKYKNGQNAVDVSPRFSPNVFAKYVSATYKEIADLCKTDLENTNKNWRIVFKYEPVQKLYVKYFDTKGNQIAVKSGDSYVREFSYKVPASHPVVDIPSNMGIYRAIAKTESDTGYITTYSPSHPKASAGDKITAASEKGSDGKYHNKYAVIFYSNQKMIQIDYAYFMPSNPYVPYPFDSSITECASKLIEIPDIGMDIAVPVIPGYTVKYYKLDPATIPDGDVTNRVTQTFGKPERPINGETSIHVPSTGTNQHIVIYYEAEEIRLPRNLIIKYVDENGKELKVPDTKTIPVGGTVNVDVPVIEDYAPIKYNKNDGEYLTDGMYEIVISYDDGIQTITIVYTRAKKLIVEYRDNASEANLPGKESPSVLYIPTTGTLDVSTVIPGYKVVGYDLNKNYKNEDYTNKPINNPHANSKLPDGSTVIPVTSTVRDQYLIIYYEKANTAITLIIEYVDENGNPVALTYTTTIEPGGSSPIPVPTVVGYTSDHFEKDGDTTPRTDWDYIIEYDPNTNEIHIKVVYKKEDKPVDTIPSVITPEDNAEAVYLYANNFDKATRANEEYDSEVAVPTSEDLYLKGEMYEYKAVADIRDTSITKNIDVTLRVTYYTDVVTKSTATQSFKYNIDLSYPYYYIGSDGVKVYDLRNIVLKNDAIKYSLNGVYSDGSQGISIPPVYPNENVPYLDYNVPKADVLNERLKVRDTGGYKVTNWNGNSCTITITDPIYVDLAASGSGSKLKEYIEDNYAGEEQSKAILEQCSYITVPTLSINWNTQADTKHTMNILTGKEYQVSAYKDGLGEGEFYVPYYAGRAPLYKFTGDANDANGKAVYTGLFVKEEAQNNTYSSSVEGDYRLVDTLTGGNAAKPEEVSHVKTEAGSINSAEKFGVVPAPINSIKVLSPIMNASETLTLDDDHKNSIQSVNVPSNVTALALDKEFSISIPNTANYSSTKGYNRKNVNASGLITGSEETKNTAYMNNKNNAANTPMNRAAILTETERNAIGPSFAEYVIVKFPFDVYLMNATMAYQTSDGSKLAYTFVNSSNDICSLPDGYTQVATNGNPVLLKANEWYNLYEYIAPKDCSNIKLRIPIWVEDGKSYTGVNGIHILVAAENCSKAQLKVALQNPTAVKHDASNATNKLTILGKSISVYVSGRIYGLQVRDTDDPGYMSKVKPALSVEKLPLAQRGQVTGYNMGLKLGYRFYFDFKTKGKSSAAVNIKPTIYYVSTDGKTVTKDISLFYRTTNGKYNKLAENDLNINMSFATTHALVNNTKPDGTNRYTAETVAARQINTTRTFTGINTIGKIIGGLTLKRDVQKLPYDNIDEEAASMGFANSTEFLKSAAFSNSISDVDPNRTNDIKNASGHWYGEYYLPASTVILMGASKTADDAMKAVNSKTDVRQGYLVVTFDEITTGTTDAGTGYLSYAKPDRNTQWVKENAHKTITLPSGATATIDTTGQAMAIYGGGTGGFLRANNDAETEGTH